MRFRGYILTGASGSPKTGNYFNVRLSAINTYSIFPFEMLTFIVT